MLWQKNAIGNMNDLFMLRNPVIYFIKLAYYMGLVVYDVNLLLNMVWNQSCGFGKKLKEKWHISREYIIVRKTDKN